MLVESFRLIVAVLLNLLVLYIIGSFLYGWIREYLKDNLKK